MCSALRVMRCALCVLATPLAAQSAQQWRDSAARLTASVRLLRDSMLQGDSTVREVARRGDMVIGASETLRGEAAAAFERFTHVRQRWFGNAAPSDDGFRIVVRHGVPIPSRPGMSEWSTVILAGLPDTGRSVRTQRMVQGKEIAEALIDGLGSMMWAQAGPVMTKWLQQPPPIAMGEKERRFIAMYAVVTGTGKAQRNCVNGVLDDCGYALWLREPKTSSPGGGYPVFVRADLLLTALDLGGPDAWTRLRQASGSDVEPMLAAAAGMPIDSLLDRWRGQLLSLRPSERPLSMPRLLLGLAWMAVLMLGALGSSRWT